MRPLLKFKISKNILVKYNYFGKKNQNLGELSIYEWQYIFGKNRTQSTNVFK